MHLQTYVFTYVDKYTYMQTYHIIYVYTYMQILSYDFANKQNERLLNT